MTGNLWGADVAQLRTLAQQFGNVSDNLMQTSLQLTNQINSNPAWKGNDATQFRSDWNGNHRALIQRTVRALKDESRKLLDNANEQEKASDAAPGSGGGPITLGDPGGSLAGVLGGVLGGGIAALKAGMTIQKFIKAPLTLAKHAGQYGWVLKNQRADFIKSFLQGSHRIGGPGFAAHRLLGNSALEGLLKGSASANRGLGLIDKATDIASLKNLNKHVGFLSKLGPVLEEKPWLGAGTKLEWLGKSGLARGLGWAGVGFSAYDSVKSFSDGDIKGGFVGVGKTALGVGCFLPPPAGTVCQVASVGIAVYENWDTISSVGKDIGEGVVNAVQDPGKFVSDTKDTLVDAGKSVGKFLGFGG
ncbi:WXG100 family type VII secretion target [Arthrobacter sp. IA7]|uniref:WXG100 family type VII secretion target n=1 Tax=Arthrobacter ipis TaxID=2716202 RepID=UPI00168A106F|nr:WXG100 family type VII secretion target [Arthrobacter ipis]MBD1544055.1 WXG100 family type VII secretion target [Arthrobacter ipis]